MNNRRVRSQICSNCVPQPCPVSLSCHTNPASTGLRGPSPAPHWLLLEQLHSNPIPAGCPSSANYTGFICTKTRGLGKAGERLKLICRFCLTGMYKTQGLCRSKSFLKHTSECKGQEISIQGIPVPSQDAAWGKKRAVSSWGCCSCSWGCCSCSALTELQSILPSLLQPRSSVQEELRPHRARPSL